MCILVNFETFFNLQPYENLDLTAGDFLWILRIFTACNFIKNIICVSLVNFEKFLSLQIY